jgi:phosphohistidine phosphatase SixA
MRKLALLTVFLAVGIFVGRTVDRDEAPVWASGEEVDSLASSAGDSNGDGTLDVSDAVHLLLHLFRGGEPPAPCQTEPVTTLIVTRHAEKASGDDPSLTPAGQLRAEQFARLIGTDDIDVLIASTLRRTIETLLPLADAKGLTEKDIVQLIDIDDVVAYVSNVPQGSTVVLAHHSFTLHQILDGLCVEGHDTIPLAGSNYDTWLVVQLPANGRPQLHYFRYAETPEIPEDPDA